MVDLANDLELIVVDGGSTDETLDIVSEFAVYFASNTVLDRSANGVYDAMNWGLLNVRTEYVYFLNSDDAVNADTLHKVLTATSKKKYDLLICAMDYESRTGFQRNFATLKRGDIFPSLSHQQIIFNKSIYDIIGNYRTDLKISADYEFFCRLQQHINTGASIELYEMPDDAITTFFQGGLSSRATIHDQLALYKMEWNIDPVKSTLRFAYNLKTMMMLKVKTIFK